MLNNQKNETRFATWKSVIISTISGLFIYYLLGYGFAPGQFSLEEISGFELVLFVVLDQFLIEALYIFILLILMGTYIDFYNLEIWKPEENKISPNLLKLIPYFGLIFFLINPITQTLRYIIRNGFKFNFELLLNEYLFSSSLYVIYTVFGSVVGVVVIAIEQFSTEKSEEKNSLDRLVGEHKSVMKPINIDEILYIEIRGRKYWAATDSKELKISKTISELEGVLDSNQFVRISRGVIINLSFVESYSPWESGTYLVELKTPKKREFSISRNRVKEFKRAMKI